MRACTTKRYAVDGERPMLVNGEIAGAGSFVGLLAAIAQR